MLRRDLIKILPKTELHLHIEGTLEPELMFRLAKKNGVNIPFNNVEEIKSAYSFHNLQSFLDIYYQGANVLVTEQDFYDLTWEYILKCKEDNIVHTEIFFDPQTHTDRGIPFDTVINGINNALVDAYEEFNITSMIFMCFLRHLSEESAFKTLEMALNHKDKIFGVGLDSSEMGNPPSKFKRVFKKAIEENFIPVAHAGEEGPSEYILEAYDLLGATRIDHGVRCMEDDGLICILKMTNTPLTVCPLSNVKLCVFDSLEDHNLKKMLEAGLLVTINSDDPAYFGGYLNQNYIECIDALDLSLEDIKTLVENSFRASYMSHDSQNYWINVVDKKLAAMV